MTFVTDTFESEMSHIFDMIFQALTFPLLSTVFIRSPQDQAWRATTSKRSQLNSVLEKQFLSDFEEDFLTTSREILEPG